ncbi:MAG TPA: hypothetical protein VEG34_03870 [Thermoanaerobaculia bacterium]|nr:hypothetical protein [Thermoanaerobaculia bacterium]
MTSRESPFACDMTAFNAAERRQHIEAIAEVFGAVEEIRELPDGYTFRLPNEAAWVSKAADFIIKERLCCPFFGFALWLEAEQGALWLSLTGREGVKPFILAEIGHALPAGRWPGEAPG